MTGDRRGAGLTETLVALLLTLGLLGVVGTVLVREQRVAAALTRRVEWLESARLARDLLELAVSADPDPERPVGDELPVRTFIGRAERCGDDGWLVSGRRLPDPERDSLQVVTGDGRVRVVRLRTVGASTCPGGREASRLDTEPPLHPDARVVRVFERGVWRVDDALRYRRGRSGAQPLTAPVLDPGRSRLSTGPEGVWLDVGGAGGAPPASRSWRFR
ncbi:MAG TPA: hypothetical protein VK858_07335 [Longimicrobiales bacterium]|nr:hypothetical protein [Longimicrobiales bacterium]